MGFESDIVTHQNLDYSLNNSLNSSPYIASKFTLVGATARDATLPFFPRRFMSQQQTIQGCIYGNIRHKRDLPLFADWYMSGNLLLDELHTTTVTLEELPQVFATLQQDRGIRPIVTF